MNGTRQDGAFTEPTGMAVKLAASSSVIMEEPSERAFTSQSKLAGSQYKYFSGL
jgi:hypothetical protein